jgi:hypothetical protein
MKIPNPWVAAQAAARAARAVMKRAPLTVSQETVDLRTKICHKCEFFDPNFGQCKVCSCIISLKAQLATEKCPKGKWPFSNQS